MNELQKAEIIFADVCDNFKADRRMVKGHSRKREYVEPRHFAMYFIRKHTNLSFERIGNFFYKDHSSVVHACKDVEGLLRYNGFVQRGQDIDKAIKKKFRP